MMKIRKDKTGLGKHNMVLVVALLLIMVVGYAIVVGAVERIGPKTTYNSHWDNTCNRNGDCVLNVYSYEKYFYNDDNEWEEIDESWSDCSTENETRFCTNEYHFRVVADESGFVTSHLRENNLRVKLANFRGSDLSFTPTMDGSMLIYEDVIPDYIDIRYQYLPRQLKEEIVIKQPLPVAITEDFDLIFDTSGNARFDIAPSIICDATGYCENINTVVSSDRVKVRVPVSFFLRDELEYPVIIDPTIELDDADISWSGTVVEDVSAEPYEYYRVNNPSYYLDLGLLDDGGNARGGLDWHVDAIPDLSEIDEINLSLFVYYVNDSNVQMEIMQMIDGGSVNYPDTNESCESGGGNCHLYTDMGNGSVYDDRTYDGANYSVNITLGSTANMDLGSVVRSRDIFSLGLKPDPTQTIHIAGKSDKSASKRPKLTITYGASAPSVSFVSPTPANGTVQSSDSIFVNVSSSDYQSDHYAFVDFDNDLRLWMRMDDVDGSGNPVDLSSYSYNGTLQGDALINSSEGYWGNGSSYDGNGDFIQTGFRGIGGSDSRSISFWLKTTNSVNSDGIVAWGDHSVDGKKWQMRININSGDGNAGAIRTENRGGRIVGTANITDGEWHHVVSVFEGTDITDVVYYVDGVLDPVSGSDPQAVDTDITGANARNVTIGKRGGFTDSYFDGAIDEVLIFNRSLNATEVAALYSGFANQYSHDFENLDVGTHNFVGHAVDRVGNRNDTAYRTVTIQTSFPTIDFVAPTPANGSNQNNSDIYINISSSDGGGEHYTFVDLDSDLLLWMRFDDINGSGDPTDLSSHARNGSLQGDASIDSGGYWGDKAGFDGTASPDDYISLPSGDYADITGKEKSLSFWMRSTSATEIGSVIASQANTSLPFWAIGSDDGRLKMQINNLSAAQFGYLSSSDLNDSQWHHVVVVIQDDNTDVDVVSYLDGVQNTSSTLHITGSKYGNDQPSIGYWDAWDGFKGDIDDFLIFDRALSSEEVSSLYNAEANQYARNFTNLEYGAHVFTGYTVDRTAHKNQTQDRVITINSPITDITPPDVEFVAPTPLHGSNQTNTDIFVHVSTADDYVEHYALVDFDSDLRLWMRMDDVNGSGHPTDLSSYGNDGYMSGNALINETGYWGNGSHYDGKQDAIQMGADNADLLIQDGSNYTISAWLNMKETSKAQGVFGGMSSSSRNNFAYAMYVNGGHIRCLIGNSTNNDNRIVVSSASADTWYHIACSWNGTTHVVYSNGVEVATEVPALTGTLPQRGAAGTIRNLIGIEFSPTNANTGFNGSIDEVMAFERALSATEIGALYNATATQYQHNFTGLSVGNHSCMGHAVDRAGNKNNTELRSVTILGANETEGDEAIEMGINNSIPGNAIETDQQIYVLNENGEHHFGSFDKATVKNNQTWAFNYVTGGESFVNMPSLFDVLHIWEEQDLTFSDIVSQVESFINNTLN